MSQDPRKSFSGLQKASTEAKGYPTVSLTTPATGLLDEEGKETIENPEASDRFSKLRNRGLNPLKPVIIANTEFVPVGGGKDPSSVGLKAQIGENNLLSVNSVTKLFEIHRQVRKATINSSEFLINRIKGVDAKKLEEIRESIEENFTDLIDEDIEKTIDAAVEMLSSSARMQRLTTFKTQGRGKSSSPMGNASLKKSGSVVVGKNPVLQELKLKNDPFIRGYVEFVILEKISFHIIKYMSGILSLKEAAARSWSVYEALSFDSTGDAASGGALSKMLMLQLQGVENVIELFEFSSDPAAEVTKALTGISTSNDTPDTSLFLQFFISAAESFLRQYESMTESVEKERNERRYASGRYPVYSQDAQSYNALKSLSATGQQIFYHSHKYHTESLDFLDSYEVKEPDEMNLLTAASVREAYNNYPNDLDKIDIHGEMLASSLFDDCISIAAHSTSTANKTRTFRAINGRSPTIENLKDFYDELLGYNNRRPFVIYGYEYKYDLSSSSLPLIKYLANRSSKSEDLSDYIPLESTHNLPTDVYDDAYLTGPEFFYDVAIQRGDTRLKEFDKFAKDHQQFAKAYVQDVYSMSRLDFLIPVARMILKDIGEELKAAANDGENSRSIFLLAMLSWKGQSLEGILDLMKSIYPGSFLKKHADSKAGDGIGDKYEFEPFVTESISVYNHSSVQKGNRRATRVAANSLISEFLTKVGDVKKSKITREKSYKHLEQDGDRVFVNIQGNKYMRADKNFAKIPDGKWVNKVNEISTAAKVRYKIRRNSGDYKNGLTKEMFNLDTGAGFRFNKTSPNLSIRKYLHNHYFQEVGMVSSEQLSNFNKSRTFKSENSQGEISDTLDSLYAMGLCYQGTSNELGLHHRLFLLYSYVAKIFSKSAELFAESNNAGKGGKVASIKLIMDKNEILGIAQAFIDIGEK